MRSFAVAFLAALSFWPPAFGNQVGNGGDAVVCYADDGALRTVRLLDLYEGQVRDRIESDLNKPTLDENFDVLMNRVRHFDPERAARYEIDKKSFFADTKFLSGVKLQDIPDSKHDYIEKGCQIEQLAIQRRNARTQKTGYFINKTLWDVMSEGHRAATVFHELVFREALNASDYVTGSQDVRVFVSRMSNSNVLNLNERGYSALLQAMDLYGVAYFWNMPVVMGTQQYDASGKLTSAEIAERPILNIFESLLSLEQEACRGMVVTSDVISLSCNRAKKIYSTHFSLEMKVGVLTIQGQLVGYRNRLAGSQNSKSEQLCYVGFDRPYCTELFLKTATFFANGHLKELDLARPGIFLTGTPTTAIGNEVLFQGEVAFHSSGFVKRGVLAEKSVLRDQSSKSIEIVAGKTVEFDFNGFVTGFSSNKIQGSNVNE